MNEGKPSATEELMAYIGFILGGLVAFFSCIAFVLSIVHLDLWGMIISIFVCILGIATLIGCLGAMDEQTERWHRYR